MAGISSLASALAPGTAVKTSDAVIVELDDRDDITNTDKLAFQYFPETISDSKGVNWAPKEVPGGSLPLYQWIGSGERRISFTAVFTTDTDISKTGQGTYTRSQVLNSRLKSVGKQSRNVDIRAAVYWLRRFILPRYDQDVGGSENTTLTRAPHKLRLVLPESGIGFAGGTASHCGRDWMTCIMTGCEVSWESFFPSGFPRIATVALSFAQTAQYNGQIEFPSASGLDADINPVAFAGNEGGKYTFGYALHPRQSLVFDETNLK